MGRKDVRAPPCRLSEAEAGRGGSIIREVAAIKQRCKPGPRATLQGVHVPEAMFRTVLEALCVAMNIVKP